jgi:hypothetical protein
VANTLSLALSARKPASLDPLPVCQALPRFLKGHWALATDARLAALMRVVEASCVMGSRAESEENIEAFNMDVDEIERYASNFGVAKGVDDSSMRLRKRMIGCVGTFPLVSHLEPGQADQQRRYAGTVSLSPVHFFQQCLIGPMSANPSAQVSTGPVRSYIIFLPPRRQRPSIWGLAQSNRLWSQIQRLSRYSPLPSTNTLWLCKTTSRTD